MSTTAMVPETVTRDEYLKALQPLLDLLHVEANEITGPIVLSLESIEFDVVATCDRSAAIPIPVTLSSRLVERPQEFVEPHFTVRTVILP